jgi:hypothetical protein
VTDASSPGFGRSSSTGAHGAFWRRTSRLDLHQQLEGHRRAVLELELLDARVGDRFEVLLVHGGTPAVGHQVLKHALTDRFAVLLAHDVERCFALAEPRHADALGPVGRGLSLGGLDPIHGDLDPEGGLAGLFLDLVDLDVVHADAHHLQSTRGGQGTTRGRI